MNYIGIDPSITSTGLVINGKVFSYTYEEKAFTKKGDYTKWYKLSEHYVNYRFHDQARFDNYQEEQVIKLGLYKGVVNNIIEDVKNNIDIDQKTLVAIEGYSYGSSAGNLIDLVTFGTLLRDSLVNMGCILEVVSPMSLKLESCKLTYDPIVIEKGVRKKRIEYQFRNNEGIAGGNFTKYEMYKSIIENNVWEDDWKKHLESLGDDINATIPKPHEDINDAYLLYQYIKKINEI